MSEKERPSERPVSIPKNSLGSGKIEKGSNSMPTYQAPPPPPPPPKKK
jgi:hypothetical protein